METCPMNSAHRVLSRNMPKHLIRCKKAADDMHKKNWKPNAKDENSITEVPRNWRPLSPTRIQRPWWEDILQQEFVGVLNHNQELEPEWEWEPELAPEIETQVSKDGNMAENEEEIRSLPPIDPGVPVCRICQIRNITLAYNCGHTTCEACYKKINNGSCPFCRRCILQKIKLFF